MRSIIIYTTIAVFLTSCGQTSSTVSSIDRSTHEMPDPGSADWESMVEPAGSHRNDINARTASKPEGVDIQISTPQERNFEPSSTKPIGYRIAQLGTMYNTYPGLDRRPGIQFGSRFSVGGPMESEPYSGGGRGKNIIPAWGSTDDERLDQATNASKSYESTSRSSKEPPAAHRNQPSISFRKHYYSKGEFQRELGDQERTLLAEADQITNKLRASDFSHAPVSEAIKNRHNDFVRQLKRRYAGMDQAIQPARQLQLTPAHTVEGRKISVARAYKSYVETKPVPANLPRQHHEALLQMADDGISIADQLYASGDKDLGDGALSIALMALDTAVDFIPGASLAKDVISLATGFNPITGDQLSEMETAFLVGQLFLPGAMGATLKALNKLQRLVNTFRNAGKFIRNIQTGIRQIYIAANDAHHAMPIEIPNFRDRSLTDFAVQDLSVSGVLLRWKAQSGATLYRVGTKGKSSVGEKAQFWSFDHPLSKGYVSRMGIPENNLIGDTFMETGRLIPGSNFITRRAPGVGNHVGGGFEIVVPPGGVKPLSHTPLSSEL